ncbi:discoidin, CUB and LCCL domain-containing protein 1 isoform X2 [Clupea harengus]|uniref:Discoidin, CUB and LCCL domain-containing protein 1 isoform X2 n=1 Tax=Clupea harengus TaxID=7950 RepID=A0A6P8G7R8_CLUHA|nr:discoidin, CUB and LCCL domain-containing protein 1 isoform X2 [Clupea harengus]
MQASSGNIWDALESLSYLWLILSAEALLVSGQEGNGCGHSVLGTKSGTLTSMNYPGTYPNHTQCDWRIRVPQGKTLRLFFGDFNLEESENCQSGSLTIADGQEAVILGPMCGHLDAAGRNVTVNSSEVTVRFVSGTHRSGRGFLMSYSTNEHPDLISCLHKGTHFSPQHFSVFCPAGCKEVKGDIWGRSEPGYRDTSVLCKAAIHAGVFSDSQGGQLRVSQERGITLYESSFANGILSKTGSLSDKKLVFTKACNGQLAVAAYNMSTVWEDTDGLGQRVTWMPGASDATGQPLQWAASTADKEPWLELELRERSTVTGIILKGTSRFYIESYSLMYSKDRKTWKLYKGALSKDKKVFEAHSDGHVLVLNSLFPPVAARYLLLQPLTWHLRASAGVQVLGCPMPRGRSVSNRMPLPTEKLPLEPVTTESPILIETSDQSSSQPMIVAVGVILGLLLCVGCLVAGLWWRRRRRKTQMKKCSLDKDCHGFHIKTLPGADSELTPYPLTRSVHDALPNPPLNDYAEPDVLSGGAKLASTFRPSLEEGYTTPFTLNHYDIPGRLPEYAEPLPPEPEYATPFGEQPMDPSLTPPLAMLQNSRHLPQHGMRIVPGLARYDSPPQKGLANGYCSPSSLASGAQRDSVVYAEPQPVEPLLKHTYHEPL